MKIDTLDIVNGRDGTAGAPLARGLAGFAGRGGSSSPATNRVSGGSFAAILNHSMQTMTDSGTTRTGKGTLVTALRPGESAAEAMNAAKTTDAAGEAHAKAVKAAEGLVSNALILPILKQLRRSPFGENSVFSGGNGEKSFGPEFDMQLSDRIARSPRLGVTNALAARLEKHANAKRISKPVAKVAAGIDLHG